MRRGTAWVDGDVQDALVMATSSLGYCPMDSGFPERVP